MGILDGQYRSPMNVQTLTGAVLPKLSGKTQPYQCTLELYTGKILTLETLESPGLKSVHPKLSEGKNSSILISTAPEPRELIDIKTDVMCYQNCLS